jgi:hypothetical protein
MEQSIKRQLPSALWPLIEEIETAARCEIEVYGGPQISGQAIS